MHRGTSRRWPAAANCIVLPPGAAHRSRTSFASTGINRAGSAAARSWTHQRPPPKPSSSVTDGAFDADVVRRERSSGVGRGVGLCFGFVGEAEVERRPTGDLAAGRVEGRIAPGGRQRCSTASASRGASIGGKPRRSRVPSTPCTRRRGPPSTSGKAVATKAWSGVPRPSFCASASRSTVRAFESSGRRWRVALSISASRSGKRRSVSPAIATASARSAEGNVRTAAAADSSVWPRRSTASSICSAARRAPTPSTFAVVGSCAISTPPPRGAGARAGRSTLRRRSNGPAIKAATASTIGMSMPLSRASRARTGAVNAPFGDRAPVGHQLGCRAAFAEALAKRKIARAGRRAGQHQVAQPGQAGERLALARPGQAEAGHFGKAAADQRGAGVLAEAAALDDAAGDRQHVLDRPADLRAGHVVAGSRCGRSGWAMRSRSRSAKRGSSAARVTAVGRPAATSCAKVGPDRTAMARRGRLRAHLDAATGRSSPRCPWSTGSAACRSPEAGRAPRACAAPGVTASQASQSARSAKFAGRADRRVERHAGQEDGVLVAGVDRFDDVGLERPQQALAAARGGDLRQRRAPGAAADHAEFFMPSPPRRGPFRRCRRAASAPAPVRRADRSGQRRGARRRPRRSSPHCRCTARRAGR